MAIVAGERGAVERAHRRHTMQQTIRLKHLVVTHAGATAIAIGVLLGGTAGAAGLATTGNLPWQSGDNAPVVVSAAARQGQLQRYYARKEARTEAMELQASALTTSAARQEQLRRFFEHKEQKLDALP
jgi:hypothetical protein